jgi:hypothetical protein
LTIKSFKLNATVFSARAYILNEPPFDYVQNIFFLNNAFVKISSQVNERLVAIAYVLTINNPYSRTIFWHFQIVVHERFKQFCPEYFGQCFVAEVVFAGLDTPSPAFDADACRRHDHMDMGVIIQFSTMGVQHRRKSCHTLVEYLGKDPLVDTSMEL